MYSNNILILILFQSGCNIKPSHGKCTLCDFIFGGDGERVLLFFRRWRKWGQLLCYQNLLHQAFLLYIAMSVICLKPSRNSIRPSKCPKNHNHYEYKTIDET